MSSRRRDRRRAREGALALLYSSDITELSVSSIVEDGAYPDDGITVSEYAETLVNGVTEHMEEIDAQLASTSENWAIDRMPFVDRAILRVAVYEMLYVDDVPVSVAINEAVELAKYYGGEDESSRFVNGVLGRIARTLERADASVGAAEVEAEVEEPVDGQEPIAQAETASEPQGESADASEVDGQ